MYMPQLATNLILTRLIFTHLIAFLHLTFSPDDCQTKSFEKMNTLLSGIFKPNIGIHWSIAATLQLFSKKKKNCVLFLAHMFVKKPRSGDSEVRSSSQV